MNTRIPDDNRTDAWVMHMVPSFISGPWFRIILAVMILVIYAIDLSSPLGMPVWLLYFIPLLLSYRSRAYYAIPTVCCVTLLFLAAGFVFSPPGIQTSAALLMRIIFSAIFVIVSVTLWTKIRREEHPSTPGFCR